MRTYSGTRNKETPGRPRPEGLPDNYFPEPDLVKAVNLAILLEKPLLVMGDPGCGKSMLAKAIAGEWYPDRFGEKYFEWNIRSGSKVSEGIAWMDHLERLRDANYPPSQDKVGVAGNYMRYGAFYDAFHASTKEAPSVLLIDEIDKADIDFPNDLLMELDKYQIKVPETKEDFKPEKRPVIIITSNKEKDLPDAFLRRCIYHYIEPLSKEKLTEIVIDRFYRDQPQRPEKLIEDAVLKFIQLRQAITADILSIGKNISTSEFIDWFKALDHYSKTDGSDEGTRLLVEELKEKRPGDQLIRIPFGNLLFKTEKSLLKFAPKEANKNV